MKVARHPRGTGVGGFIYLASRVVVGAFVGVWVVRKADPRRVAETALGRGVAADAYRRQVHGHRRRMGLAERLADADARLAALVPAFGLEVEQSPAIAQRQRRLDAFRIHRSRRDVVHLVVVLPTLLYLCVTTTVLPRDAEKSAVIAIC